jgi:hypothetical protein
MKALCGYQYCSGRVGVKPLISTAFYWFLLISTGFYWFLLVSTDSDHARQHELTQLATYTYRRFGLQAPCSNATQLHMQSRTLGCTHVTICLSDWFDHSGNTWVLKSSKYVDEQNPWMKLLPGQAAISEAYSVSLRRHLPLDEISRNQPSAIHAATEPWRTIHSACSSRHRT